MSKKGVEITENSKPIQSHPFEGSTVFFMGNEGSGLAEAHKQYCDYFVYIPQFTNKTASLNVACAASIVFHHFACKTGIIKYGQAIRNPRFLEISSKKIQ